MKRFTATLITCLVLALGAAACSGGDGSPSTVPPGDTTTSTGEQTTSVPDDGGSSTTTEAPPPQAGPAVLALEGADPIVLTTEAGGGQRPMLTWEPVAGTDIYAVFVYTADGDPYWAARTPEAQLRVGGVEIPDSAVGPRIADGYRWMVYAIDADGQLITSSELGTLTP